MEERFDIVSFSRDDLSDFYDWILPDVYTELLGVEDFADEGVIAVGALREGTPCGAAICVYSGNDTFSLISIIVGEPERRKGGGLQLLDAAVNEALHLTAWQGNDLSLKKLELTAEYVLPEDAIDGMDSFLSAYGFRDFAESSPVYLWNAADVGQNLVSLTPFTELQDEGEEMLTELEESDLSPDPELSFYTGEEQNAPLVFATDPAGDNTYFVSSGVFGEVGSAEFEQAFLTVLKKIGDADPDATVIASASSNPYADTLERLARESGTVCVHRQASCYVLLRAEENE